VRATPWLGVIPVGFVPRPKFSIALKQELQSAGDHLVIGGAAEPAVGPQSLLYVGFDCGFDLGSDLFSLDLNNWHGNLLFNSFAVTRGATSEAGHGHAALGGGWGRSPHYRFT